jgi:hypothetical protein
MLAGSVTLSAISKGSLLSAGLRARQRAKKAAAAR